jgi:hypothetical protein
MLSPGQWYQCQLGTREREKEELKLNPPTLPKLPKVLSTDLKGRQKYKGPYKKYRDRSFSLFQEELPSQVTYYCIGCGIGITVSCCSTESSPFLHVIPSIGLYIFVQSTMIYP